MSKIESILFVCLGNICRSPSAEAVFRKKLKECNIPIYCDSAGTAGYHIGERSDARSIQHAEKRGYKMTHLARQLKPDDFEKFDLILVMDQDNHHKTISICPSRELKAKVKMLTDFCQNVNPGYVPDPYYGTPTDFENVLNIVEDACSGFIKSLSN